MVFSQSARAAGLVHYIVLIGKILTSLGMQRQTRQEVLRDLNEAIRRVGAQSVLMSDLVSRLVGLNSTDLECLDLLLLSGVTTAGQLAAHSGLTTGAMTAVIDRLERAGFARRRRDLTDRRRVMVEALPRVVQEIGPLYRPLLQATETLHDQYDDKQLALVTEYLSRAFGLAAEHVNWLQTQPPLSRTRRLKSARKKAGAQASSASGRVTTAETSTKTTWVRIASADIERPRARR